MRADRDFRRLPFDPFKIREDSLESSEKTGIGSRSSEPTFFIKGQEADFERAIEKVIVGREGELLVDWNE